MLQRSPIASLKMVENRATESYSNKLVARGRALRDLVDEWLSDVETSAEGSTSLNTFAKFVVLTRQGMGTSEASRELGLSASHVSREYKRLLVSLLTERITGMSH